MTCATVVEIG